jgi:cardiolipin synthase
VLTVPNLISVMRLACIPLFLYLLFGKEDRVAAAVLLLFLGGTDWVDGYIARHHNQVSELGKILDPTADRLLFIVGVTAIIIDGSAPLWFAILVVVREVCIGVVLAVLYLLGMQRFDVTFLGKTATFLLMVTFPLFLMGSADVAVSDLCWLSGWLLGLPGLALSYYTAITYIPTMRRSLTAGRAARRAARMEEQR